MNDFFAILFILLALAALVFLIYKSRTSKLHKLVKLTSQKATANWKHPFLKEETTKAEQKSD